MKCFSWGGFMKNEFSIKDINVNYFYETTIETIVSWEDVGLDSVVKKAKLTCEIEKGLNDLNFLINNKNNNVEDIFLNIIKDSIEARKALIGLVALDSYGGAYIKGKNRFINLKKDEIFLNKTLAEDDIKELLYMFNNSGLKSVIINPYIKDLKSYYVGVIYGVMGSNSRKNATGKVMERLCEDIISDFCDKNRATYIKQAGSSKILSKFGISVKCDKKKFDYIIKMDDKLYFFEVNYYATNGSKLKSCCQEYINSKDMLKKQGHEFIWITDGHGWVGTRSNLTEAYEKIENILNFNMIENNALELIIKTH